MFSKITNLLPVSLILILFAGEGNSQLNPHFPPNEGNLSVPILERPIHECALRVHVFSVAPRSIVRVFANGVEVGNARPLIGEAYVNLNRAPVLNEVVTARQTVDGVTSDPSASVTVDSFPRLSTPVPVPAIYACGRVVPVDNLTPSTRVAVSDLDRVAPVSQLIGTAENTSTWTPAVTESLQVSHHVNAVQVACPDIPAKTATSPSSQPPLLVSPSPVPVPAPTVDPVVVEGSDAIVLHNLFPGAELEVKAGSTVISSGALATATDNWVGLNVPAPRGPTITASQKLCTTSAPSGGVVATDQLPAPRLRWPICAGSRLLSIDGTIPNATVVLLRRPAGGSAVPVGYAGAVLGTLSMTIAPSITLSEGEVVFAIQFIGNIVSGRSNEVTVGCDGGANVITQHNDNFRTGAYLAERILIPAAVRSRRMVPLFRVEQLSGNVITQTLYVRNVDFASGRANAVYAATLANSVYAFDADNGTQKWRVDLQDTDPRRPVPLGIETTPVIDLTTNRIYVLFRTGNRPANKFDFQDATVNQAYWLVALDLRSRAELARTEISASVYRNDGQQVTFSAKTQIAHSALLLDHGSLYVAFGSRADSESERPYYPLYHGWVVQYRAIDLARERVFCTSPNPPVRRNVVVPGLPAASSGIWQGGGGLAADPNGSIFFLTGNGRLELNNALYGDSFVKLLTSGPVLIPMAYAPPLPAVDQLEVGDADLGSGGPLVIPGTNFVIGGGKTGFMYLLDRSSMQLVQQITAATNQYTGERDRNWEAGPHLHGSPTFWAGTNYLYIWGEKDFLNAFEFTPATGMFSNAPVHRGTIEAQPLTMPGGMLSLSANGNDPRTGIVWAIISTDNIEPGQGIPRGELLAFDAQTLELLWSQAIGHTPHWAPPTIADGKVFVTNFDRELIAFVLGPEPNAIPWTPYRPALAYRRCQTCHTEAAIKEFARTTSLTKFYFNEARFFQLPAQTMRRLSVPTGLHKGLTLEGTGVATYEAQPNPRDNRKLSWILKGTTAELSEFEPEPGARENNPTLVRISSDSVWTATDGGKIQTKALKTVPAPVSISLPWVSYDVVKTNARGVLSGYSTIQRVQTHGGQAPVKPPRHTGEIVKTRFAAEYWFYGPKK
jgi:hypothetical protein